MLTRTQVMQGYADLFENLSPERISEFEQWIEPDIRFRDPFNEVRGYAGLKALTEDMFARTRNPRFQVLEHQLGGDSGYIRWLFTATLPVLGDFSCEGVTRLQFSERNLISEHLDYWDSAPIYLRLPILGRLLRWVRGKMALPAEHQHVEN